MASRKGLQKKLQGWNERILSKAGHEVLIKAVTQAIPTYTMSCFKLPKGFCDDINSLTTNFWWGNSSKGRKIHWSNWLKMCRSKELGGIGFRDFQAFNLVLLAKQGWRLVHNTQSLVYQVYKARYFPKYSFLEAVVGTNPSQIWRSILSARELIQAGTRWNIGDGRFVRVWDDKWLPCLPGRRPNGPAVNVVRDLVDDDSQWWNLRLIDEVFDETTAQTIKLMPLVNLNSRDCPV